MKISLKKYDDLGKCTAFTLEDDFDTETDHIYVYCFNSEGNFTKCEIPINDVNDLIPWLWHRFGIYSCGEEGRNYFSNTANPCYWWENRVNGHPVSNEFASSRVDEVIKKIKEDNK